MTTDAANDDTAAAADTEEDDEANSDPGDAGTPAEHDDEDLQSPPLEVDELPAH